MVTVDFWAKHDAGRRLGLVEHMLDAAATAFVLACERTSSTAATTPCMAPETLAFLCGLHDFGKAIPGFQNRIEDEKSRLEQSGLRFSKACFEDRHDRALLRLLDEEWSLHPPPKNIKNSLVAALAAHHGAFFGEAVSGPVGTGKWIAARGELLARYVEAFGAEPVWPERFELGAAVPFAGFVTVCDWIASNSAFFPLGRVAQDPRRYYAESQSLAKRALNALDLLRDSPKARPPVKAEALLAEILGPGLDPRPLQREGARLLAQCDEPFLLLVEAPMGEGKTELAFMAQLLAEHAVAPNGLYIGLPTRASGVAMFERTKRFLERRSRRPAGELALAVGGTSPRNGESDDDVAAVWFSRRKRALLAPYGVGTLDQALLSVLNVRHHFVRLFGLAGKVVVLDEIHAYDVYTSGLVRTLVQWLKRLGASVVVMSATLPRDKRLELVRAWTGEGAPAPEAPPYPRLFRASANTTAATSVESTARAPIRLEGVGATIPELAAAVLAEREEDGATAVIVNTVSRAQELFGLLDAALPASVERMLFHARFPFEERERIERRVLDAFGPDGVRPKRAVVVATQVLEQSLDVDFDRLFSDFAPVDLLLQRSGRLHRRRRQRPTGRTDPVLTVAGLHRDSPPDLESTGLRYVYPDEYILLRSWAFIRDLAELRPPDDIDRLVQAVYGDEPTPVQDADFLRRLDAAREEALREHERQALFARQNAISSEAPNLRAAYPMMESSDEDDPKSAALIAKTRLGEDSVTLIPLFDGGDGLWRIRPGEPGFDPGRKPSPELSEALWRRFVRTSRKSLVFQTRKTQRLVHWDRDPLLRGMHPLLLGPGFTRVGGDRVRLDPVLGLVIEKEGT